MFTITGELVKRIGVGVVGNGDKDACFGANGEIIVADKCNNRVCVFSSDCDGHITLIKAWGSQDSTTGHFRIPRALTVSGSHLYMMDAASVQVFQ